MTEYIERETLISELSASCMPIDDREISGLFDCDESIRDIIDAIPAADVRPERHGHWEEHEEIYAQCLYFCSECNKGQVRGSKTPFCPFCGAKMDGKEDEK